MKDIVTIQGINEIINRYNIFILDQWGVMHDGNQAYQFAITCIKQLYDKNKKLIIISNSSKRKNTTENNLPQFGFDPDHFLEIMTSGEMIWKSLVNLNYNFAKKLKNNCFHIYDDTKNDGKSFLEGLDKYNFVNDIENADFILGCTPYQNSKTIDYIPLLSKAIQRNLPFVCANPDFETIENISNRYFICMGTIAELYNNMGGQVLILGKPSVEIYKKSTEKIKNINKSKMIAIGDSLHHDIKGANAFGIDSVLITSGIHTNHFDKNSPKWKSNLNQLQKLGIEPTFLCSEFKQ